MICPECGADIEPAEFDDPTMADRTTMSIRVFWETKDWTPAKFRNALVEARLRQR